MEQTPKEKELEEALFKAFKTMSLMVGLLMRKDMTEEDMQQYIEDFNNQTDFITIKRQTKEGDDDYVRTSVIINDKYKHLIVVDEEYKHLNELGELEHRSVKIMNLSEEKVFKVHPFEWERIKLYQDIKDFKEKVEPVIAAYYKDTSTWGRNFIRDYEELAEANPDIAEQLRAFVKVSCFSVVLEMAAKNSSGELENITVLAGVDGYMLVKGEV